MNNILEMNQPCEKNDGASKGGSMFLSAETYHKAAQGDKYSQQLLELFESQLKANIETLEAKLSLKRTREITEYVTDNILPLACDQKKPE